MPTSQTLLYESNILSAQINALNNKISETAFIFRSQIEKLTIIVTGKSYEIGYTKIIDVKPPQSVPPEIKTFFEQYSTRLIAERNILQSKLDELMQTENSGIPSA